MKSIIRLFSMLIFSLLVTALVGMVSFASPACPQIREVTQPSGEKIKIKLNGDERLLWNTDDKGNVVVKGSDNYWYYGELKEGKITSSKIKAGQANSSKGLLTNNTVIENIKKNNLNVNSYSKKTSGHTQSRSVASTTLASSTTAYTSPQKLLVVLVSMTDISISESDSAWYNYFFGTSGSTVRTYFNEASGGRFYFTPAQESNGTSNDGIIRVSLNYGDQAHRDTDNIVVKDALKRCDSYINFASYDTNNDGTVSPDELHMIFVVAGYEACLNPDGLSPWTGAHTAYVIDDYNDSQDNLDNKNLNRNYCMIGELYTQSTMTTIGSACHELGHDIGMEDLYDYDYSSSGVGNYSLMGFGNWCYTNNLSGSCPCHPDAYNMILVGWVTPYEVSTEKANYTLNSSKSSGYNVLKVNNPAQRNEYFLLENRQFTGFDEGLTCINSGGNLNSGIAIWHVNENAPDYNNDETNKLVDLEEANEGVLGFSALDENSSPVDALYNSSNGLEFGSFTIPSSRWYGEDNVTPKYIRIPCASSNSMTIIVSEMAYKNPNNGHTYAIINESMSWSTAENYCERVGGHLATITSSEEQTWLQDTIYAHGNLPYYWLGAKQPSGSPEPGGNWQWITGESFSYTNWLSGQPDNWSNDNVAAITTNRDVNGNNSPGKWHDDIETAPGRQTGAICEWDSVYFPFNGHVYSVIDKPMSWSEAKTYCENLGGHLVTITGIEEHNFVTSLAINSGNSKGYWLGYNQAPGSYEPFGGWSWITGEEVLFENWLSGQPDNGYGDSAAMMFRYIDNNGNVSPGRWCDELETPRVVTPQGFICEWDGFYNPQNGHTYRLIDTDANNTWDNAKAQCEALGGHLATITTKQEQDFLATSALPGTLKYYWLGLKQAPGSAEPAGGWSWITGETSTFSNWVSGQPDNWNGDNVASMVRLIDFNSNLSTGKWGDDCNNPALGRVGYVCEWDTSHQPLIVDDFSSRTQFDQNNNDLSKTNVRGIDNCYYYNDNPGDIGIASSVASQYFQLNVGTNIGLKWYLSLRLKDTGTNGSEQHWNIVLNDGTDHIVPLGYYGTVTNSYKDFKIPLSSFYANLGNIQYIKIVHADSTYANLFIDDIRFN